MLYAHAAAASSVNVPSQTHVRHAEWGDRDGLEQGMYRGGHRRRRRGRRGACSGQKQAEVGRGRAEQGWVGHKYAKVHIDRGGDPE